MRNGYTTGTTACAAAFAACVLKLTNRLPEKADIFLPDGFAASIPVFMDNTGVFAVKDGGDDIDATHGLKIYADVKITDSGGIKITGGKGIGKVTRKGLQVHVGEYAINPVPIEMIKYNLTRITPHASITIFSPDGEKAAKNTFNEKIGIIGGISIIGTTGIVTPMSVEAIIETIKCEIDVAAAEGHKTICFTPGKTGEKNFCAEYDSIPVTLMSNYTAEAFSYAKSKGFNNIFVAGHPGKLCKILMGYYNTHSKNSPMAADFLSEKLCLNKKFNTVEEILQSSEKDISFVAEDLAYKIEKDFGFKKVSVIFYDMKGSKKGERL